MQTDVECRQVPGCSRNRERVPLLAAANAAGPLLPGGRLRLLAVQPAPPVCCDEVVLCRHDGTQQVVTYTNRRQQAS